MIRFDRNEFSGAFGDIGTDLPLLVGMILASGLDAASVLIVYGILQILTALRYGIPMPVQPLKAVATIVIAQKISGGVIYGAGFSIGVVMLILTLTGGLTWLTRVIPAPVVRGIQFGLGLQLSMLALGKYVIADGTGGTVLAAVAFVITLLLVGNRKFPPALVVIGLGVVYALVYSFSSMSLDQYAGFKLPVFALPTTDNILQGFLLLALPQIPLSLGNSILATEKLAHDYFPEKKITARAIGLTYSVMNLAAPLWGGLPVCHGSGGLAGHYLFGGRTGGSVVIYGGMYLIVGLFFSAGFASLIHIFPLPVLGVILLFEGIALLRLVGDTMGHVSHFRTALIVGVIAAFLPYGYVVGMIVGTLIIATPFGEVR